MQKIIRDFNFEQPNNDKIIVQAIRLNDARYKDGVMYTFRYLRRIESTGTYETAFAVENCHGQPHMHIGEETYEVDYDWKQAFAKFDELKSEYEKKISLRKQVVCMAKIIIKDWESVRKETIYAVEHSIPQKEDCIIYFNSIEDFRKVLTAQRMRLLSTVKNQKPASLYALSKLLKRDFKSISVDAKLLSEFGLLSFVETKRNGRRTLRPITKAKKIEMKMAI